MSRSYRDKDRIENHKALKEISESVTSLTPDDLAQKYSKAKRTKEITRYGNQRKSVAKEKVHARRKERKERKRNNVIDDNS